MPCFPEQLWDGLCTAPHPALLPTQSHHSVPRALPEVTIPAFLFSLCCKIAPLCSLSPFVPHPRHSDMVSEGNVPRGGHSPQRVGDTLAAGVLCSDL